MINIFKSQNEATPSHEKIAVIVVNIEELRLAFIRTQLKMTTPEGIGFIITAVNVARSIHVSHCNVSGYPIYESNFAYFPFIHVFVGDRTAGLDTTAVVTVLIEQSNFVKCFIDIHCFLPFSVILVTIRDVILHDTILSKINEGGVVGFHLENCVFSASSESRPRGIHVEDGLYVYIYKCEFTINDINCVEGCAVYVKGLRAFTFSGLSICFNFKKTKKLLTQLLLLKIVCFMEAWLTIPGEQYHVLQQV